MPYVIFYNESYSVEWGQIRPTKNPAASYQPRFVQVVRRTDTKLWSWIYSCYVEVPKWYATGVQDILEATVFSTLQKAENFLEANPHLKLGEAEILELDLSMPLLVVWEDIYDIGKIRVELTVKQALRRQFEETHDNYSVQAFQKYLKIVRPESALADLINRKKGWFELLQQQPRALPASGERREECERVDDAPLTYAEGAGRGDGGNEQISYAEASGEF